MTVLVPIFLLRPADLQKEVPEHTSRLRLANLRANRRIVAPFFVIGGSDSKHFQARDFAPDVYTITGIQLESTKEFAGFHGVNERIKVDEYAKTIAFFYQIMNNLDDL